MHILVLEFVRTYFAVIVYFVQYTVFAYALSSNVCFSLRGAIAAYAEKFNFVKSFKWNMCPQNTYLQFKIYFFALLPTLLIFTPALPNFHYAIAF